MSAISSGRNYLKIFSRLIIGHESWQDYMIDYFNAAVQDLVETMSSESGIVGEPLPVVSFDGAPTHRVLKIAAGEYRFLLNNQVGIFTPGTTPGCDDIPYDEAAAQYMALKLDEYPVATDVGTDGTVGYKWNILGVGENHTPSAVSVGASSITLIINTIPVWTNAAATRPVVVYLVSPITSSVNAIYSGTLALVGGALEVTVPHFLSQAIPSTTAADYRVFVAGPSIAAVQQSAATFVRVCEVTLGAPDPNFIATYTTVKNLTSLKAIITAIAQALTGVSVTNMSNSALANLIINRIATVGEFTTDLKVATNPAGAFLNFLAREVYGAGLYRGYLQTGNIYTLFGLATGAPGSAVNRIDENGNVTANNVSVAGKVSNGGNAVVFDDGIDIEGTTKLRGKVCNDAGADVVFDDGVTVEGPMTAQGGVTTVTPVNVVAVWNSGTSEMEATMNECGGIVEVPFDGTTPLPAAVAGIVVLRLTNDRIGLSSRVQVTIEYSGTGATKLPNAVCEVNGDELVVSFFNHGSAAVQDSVFVQFDVINPAPIVAP